MARSVADASAAGTVGDMLAAAARLLRVAAGEAARLEAEVLLAHAAGVRREWLMAHPEAVLPQAALRRFARTVERRHGERVPVAYLTGGKEFAGLRFEMRPGVFIPRPETEGLLERVEAWLGRRLPLAAGTVVVDACTGSGVLAVALARRLGVSVIATDRSAAAVALVRSNARRLGVSRLVRVLRGDGLAPLGFLRPVPRVAALVSNPPYVRNALLRGLSRDIRDHEPRCALAGGVDGLVVVRRLLRQAAALVEPGGLVAFEIAADQRRAMRSLLAVGGWVNPRVEPDLAGRARYALAERGKRPQ